MIKYVGVLAALVGLAACSGGGPSSSSAFLPQQQASAPGAARHVYAAGKHVIYRTPGTCTPVTTTKGPMTASIVATPGQVVNPSAPTILDIDATGCDIGVYIPSASNGVTISYTTIHDANQYGVFNDGGSGADVDNSTIAEIGNHNGLDFAPNGVQTGVGIYEMGGGTKIDSNIIYQYQKNGMSLENKSQVIVTHNVVSGLGKVNFIAQNGIELYHAHALEFTGNVVSDNWYTGPTYTATGYLLMFYNGPSKTTIKATNTARYNQTNFYFIP